MEKETLILGMPRGAGGMPAGEQRCPAGIVQSLGGMGGKVQQQAQQGRCSGHQAQQAQQQATRQAQRAQQAQAPTCEVKGAQRRVVLHLGPLPLKHSDLDLRYSKAVQQGGTAGQGQGQGGAGGRRVRRDAGCPLAHPGCPFTHAPLAGCPRRW